MARIQVLAEVTGRVWKIEKAIGESIAADEALLIVESMKMEIPVTCLDAGTLAELRVAEGDPVAEGQVVAIVET